MASYCSAR